MLIQYGVLAYRLEEGGGLRLLLITSRDTGRWVIPRGNPIKDLPPHLSAAQEAFEEAGVTGPVGETSIGSYPYMKRRKHGAADPTLVHVYPLEVTEQSEHWPEQDERRTQWFEPRAAADAVDEPELSQLILGFRPPQPA